MKDLPINDRGQMPIYSLGLEEMLPKIKKMLTEKRPSQILAELFDEGYQIEDVKIVIYHALYNEGEIPR